MLDMYAISACFCNLRGRTLVYSNRQWKLCLSSLCFRKSKKKRSCFDYFSLVVFQMKVKSRAVLPLMFLGHSFSSYFNNDNLLVNKSKSKT
jgi:hypothetical protein